MIQKIIILLLLIINLHSEDISECKRGWNETTLKNYDSAIILFEKCIKNGKLTKQSLAQTYRNIGITYMRSGKAKKAIKNYNIALKYNSKNNVDDYVNRGNAWSELGNYNKALKDYNKALKIKPNYKHAYFNRGILSLKLGLLKKANIDFRQAYKYGLRTKKLYSSLNTIKEIESRHASAAFVMTISNFIGNTAKACIPHLKKNDKWMHNLVSKWTGSNKEYVDASKLWMQKYFTEISNYNEEISLHLQDKLHKIVMENSNLSKNDTLSVYSNKIKACKKFEKQVLNEGYNITDKIKIYKELENLVKKMKKYNKS